MADTFDRFLSSRKNHRALEHFPAPPEDLKQRPDYARAYDAWHTAIERWRDGLQDQFDQVRALESRVEELENEDGYDEAVQALEDYKKTVIADLSTINLQIQELFALVSAESAAATSGVTYGGVLARTLGS